MADLQKAELLDLLRQPADLTLAFDTNAIFGNSRSDPFVTLCDEINLVNSLLDGRKIRTVISAPVYVEKLHDMRQGFGTGFDPEEVGRFLASKGVEVLDLTGAHAQHLGALLGEKFPSSADWHGFKRRRCLQCLGLSQNHQATGTGKNCGATVDWLVAGHAHAEGFVLVTDDKGPEFDVVQRKARLETVVDSLEDLRASLRPETKGSPEEGGGG